MILDRITLEQSKTHCGRRLMTDIMIADVVTNADGDLEQNQPFGAESIKMHVSLTCKYGNRVRYISDVYRLFFWFASLLDKKIKSLCKL